MSSSSTGSLRLREQDLSDKVAVVTGATKGIGHAVALNLASRGCSILATCSNPDTLHLTKALADEVASLYQGQTFSPPRVVGISANILQPDCAIVIADSLAGHFGGHADIFVNNAGITGPSPVGTLEPEHIQTFTLGNIQTPALIVDTLVRRQMFRPDSRIVFISSVRSKAVSGASAMYSATKAAGEALVRSWADAFGGNDPQFEFMAGTTANAVLVGLTKTDAVHRLPPGGFESLAAKYVTQQSIPRIAEAEEVADVVGLLCSKEARWMTGSVIPANGGIYKIG